ncbi:MAG: methyltransferase domain-containing protein [Candidatus Anstonellales archaeon]
MRKNKYNPHFPPILLRLKRGPQVLLPKDIGLILGFSGAGKNSRCLDAGSGSGFLAIALGNVCKSVVSYEWREDFFLLAQENVSRSGLKNVKIVKRNIFDGIKERNLDLITLDMANSDRIVGIAYKALKVGGFLVGYLPHAEQVQKFAFQCRLAGFSEVFTLESIVREYLAHDSGFRPQNMGLTHTAYLVFAKK